jgi:hypothetical protein
MNTDDDKTTSASLLQNCLLNEVFTCMQCGKDLTVEQGTWPMNDYEGEPIIETDYNDRVRAEFCCYDCAG